MPRTPTRMLVKNHRKPSSLGMSKLSSSQADVPRHDCDGENMGKKIGHVGECEPPRPDIYRLDSLSVEEVPNNEIDVS